MPSIWRMREPPVFPAWVTPNPSSRLRLFCLPHAGGNASVFRTWRAGLREAIEVCPVQLPGRGNRILEPPVTRLPDLCGGLADALRPYLDVPFAFFGHSMGALIGFEITRHLRRRFHLRPVHLFVSSFRAPQKPSSIPPIHELPEPALIEELRRLNGTLEAVWRERQLAEIVLPLLRADFELCETYAYSREERLDCPISAFGGTEDDQVSREELAAWGHQTRARFTLRMFPGDHFFLQGARTGLLEAISGDLIPSLGVRQDAT